MLCQSLMRLNVHSEFLRLVRDGGEWEAGYLCPTTYSLHCQHQTNCIKAGSCMRHFNVALIVWAKSHDKVSINHKFWRERRAEADRTEVLLLTSLARALPLGHTGSRFVTKASRLIRIQYFTPLPLRYEKNGLLLTAGWVQFGRASRRTMEYTIRHCRILSIAYRFTPLYWQGMSSSTWKDVSFFSFHPDRVCRKFSNPNRLQRVCYCFPRFVFRNCG